MACHSKAECRENGGKVIDDGCATILMPYSCGDSCTFWVPIENCEWHCALPAEGGK